jgi:hypothetical protein
MTIKGVQFEVIFDYITTELHINVNYYSRSSDAEELNFSGTGAVLRIGGISASNLDGRIAEFLFFDRVISDSERTKIEGCLAHKWALTSYLPTSDIYKGNMAMLYPIIVSATAEDVGGGADVQASDNTTLVFDGVTNKPTETRKSNLDDFISFGSSVLRDDYSGAWNVEGNVLVITVDDADNSTISADNSRNYPLISSVIVYDTSTLDGINNSDDVTLIFDGNINTPSAGTKALVMGPSTFLGLRLR